MSDTEPPFRVAVRLFGLALLCLSCGCSTLVSHQVREDPDGTRIESWQRVRTFWDSHSSVTQLRASTTDKTQGLTLTGLDQDTAASNAVNLVSESVGAAVRAAVTATVKP